MPNFGFGQWKRAPRLWYWFKRMQERCAKHNIPCIFPFTKEGYDLFVNAIGPIPENMKNISIGRIDHNQGYVYNFSIDKWNFSWQERSENSRESIIRNNIAKIGNEKSASSPNRNSLQIIECPHCKISGKLPPMKRWHFDNCKKKQENR